MHGRCDCEDAMMILNTCENFLYTVDQDQIILRRQLLLSNINSKSLIETSVYKASQLKT